MTVYTLESDMPRIDLPGTYQLVFEAISDSTGNAVTGVTVSEIALYGPTPSVSVDDVTAGDSYSLLDFLYVPQTFGTLV
jgi:hypothetical protein